jgi:hypothetical protein
VEEDPKINELFLKCGPQNFKACYQKMSFFIEYICLMLIKYGSPTCKLAFFLKPSLFIRASGGLSSIHRLFVVRNPFYMEHWM